MADGKYDFTHMKPEYKQLTKLTCSSCGALNEVETKTNINWKTRAFHSEAVIAYLLSSMNDIIREIESYGGCEMNRQVKVLWKQKVRYAISKLKNKKWRDK